MSLKFVDRRRQEKKPNGGQWMWLIVATISACGRFKNDSRERVCMKPMTGH